MKQLNVIAFLVFLGGLAWVFFLKPDSVAAARSFFLGWFSPVIKASGAVQGEAGEEDPRTRAELQQTVRHLEEKVFNLEFRQHTFDRLEEENARLRADLEFRENQRYNLTIPAQVIKRTRTSWWSTVTINRGRRHRVTKDLPVINRDHAVVGKVTGNGLTEDTAEVLLLTDEQCRVAARVGRSVSLRGIVQGYRGLGNLTSQVRLTILDPDIVLPAGAILYTDDFEGQIFPPGLLIGRVIEQVQGELYDSAIIEPQVDFSKLDSVFVIQAEADEEEKKDLDPAGAEEGAGEALTLEETLAEGGGASESAPAPATVP